MNKKHFRESISTAKTEEELKFAFVKYFDLPFSTKNRIDLYTAQILFEFKLDDNLNNVKILAKTVAQALYYIRRLKIGDDDRSPSENVCVVTKNRAAFFKTEIFADFYSNDGYDWDLKPSAPCKRLVADLSAADSLIHAHVYDFSVYQEEIAFVNLIERTRKRQSSLFQLKKQITAQNFYQAFLHWQNFFGDDVRNGHKPSEYFLADIEQGKSHIHDGKVYFELAGEQIIRKLVNPDEYKYFWNHYAKISSAREIILIRQKMDRMTEINLRRFTGEFYTPLDFAKKAFDYLTRTVTLDKNFRIWDMAAGTGNLEFAIPPEFIKNCYISTLIEDEANYCRQIFSDATVFQYDYLNDREDKLPQKLRTDLNNPEIKWIIFINPPYATASILDRNINRISKDTVSMTEIRKQMTAENMGKASRELCSQFLYRISKDFTGRTAYIGIFSKVKYINSELDQKFRDKVFQYKFERGFVFNSKNFDGCKGQFPVGFLVWNLSERIKIESQEILLDIYDSEVEKVGEKIFRPSRSDESLNKWIFRPKRVKKFPPMSSALKLGDKNKIPQDMVAENFLAGLMCVAGDFSHQNYTALLSGPYAGGGECSITAENFEQAMVVHMVRRLPKANWLNDRDQFMQPNKKLPLEFISDAVIWSLFAPSNQTASLSNVEYEGEIYRLKNNFYPFLLSELREWYCSSPKIRIQIEMESEDRFAALWIKNNRLSVEAEEVLSSAREIYKKFYAELANLDVRRWKITDWDAGWYQIRNALGESLKLEALSAKLLPQIYELGFLRDEVRYF